MNRDKLPFPDKLPYTTHSNDNIKATNPRHDSSHANDNPKHQTQMRRQLSTTAYRPTGQDIICGRGRGSFLHEGNKVYLALLRKNVHAYLAATKRVEKSVIISTVVASLKDRGFRFLKQDETNERWYELSETESYDRTAHAIRDLIRKQKGRNKKTLSKSSSSTLRTPSPSPSNSDISVGSYKTEEPIPLRYIREQPNVKNTISSSSSPKMISAASSSNVASLSQPTDNPDLPIDADSFDEKISEIPSEVMSPTDPLKTGGFDVFFEFDPEDFGQVLSQLDTEKQERRASWDNQESN